MGMYDEIVWEQPLPDGRLPAGSVFQTKSFGRNMDRFTLNNAGRLIEHVVKYTRIERVRSDSERFLPILQAVPVGDVDTGYHGDIVITAVHPGDSLIEYVARFTYGTLDWVKPLGMLTEADTHCLYYTD